MSVGAAQATVDTLKKKVDYLTQQALSAPTFEQANAISADLQAAMDEWTQAKNALTAAMKSDALAQTVLAQNFTTAASSAISSAFDPSLDYASSLASAQKVKDAAFAGAFGNLAINESFNTPAWNSFTQSGAGPSSSGINWATFDTSSVNFSATAAPTAMAPIMGSATAFNNATTTSATTAMAPIMGSALATTVVTANPSTPVTTAFTYSPYSESSNYYSPYVDNNFTYYSPYSQVPMGLSDLEDTTVVVQLRQEEIKQEEKDAEIRRRIQADENFRKYREEQRIHQEISQRLINMQNHAYAESLKGQPLWRPNPPLFQRPTPAPPSVTNMYTNPSNDNSSYSGFSMPPLSFSYDTSTPPAPDPTPAPAPAPVPQPDPPPSDGGGTAAKAY